MRDPIGFVQKLAQRAAALLAAAAVVFLSACESTNVPDHAQATQHPATAGYQPFEAR
jgi:hypothetical protein